MNQMLKTSHSCGFNCYFGHTERIKIFIYFILRLSEYLMRILSFNYALELWLQFFFFFFPAGLCPSPLFLFAILLKGIQHTVTIIFIQWRQGERDRNSHHRHNLKWTYRNHHICEADIWINSNELYFTNTEKCSWGREKIKIIV